MGKSDQDEPVTSPIAFHPSSNGEFCPTPESERDRRANARWRELVEEKHKRVGMTRRQFAESACGYAASLLVLNEIYGCGGGGAKSGGPDGGAAGGGADASYDVTPEMTEDHAQACAKLLGGEFVFDIQVHPPNPLSPWTPRMLPMDAETLIRTIFVDSDTSIACLTGIPDAREAGATNVAANRQLQEIIDRYAGPRLIFHGNVDPTKGAPELDYMAQLAATYKLGAWKCYPHVGTWRLDRDVGMAFVEQARALGIKVIAAHRGIGPGVTYTDPSSPVDLAFAAKAAPDVKFLTYHSGWDPLSVESEPYDPTSENPEGVSRLVRGVLDAGIPPHGNVYAELGSTWRNIMTKPIDAAHVLGKLLKYLGEDRVLWGTDSVFTGSAQEQIVAFRAFQIPEALQAAHGYPALTPAIKQKILGENAAAVYGIDMAAARCAIEADGLNQLKMARREDPRAAPLNPEKSYGPKTRREYLSFLSWERQSREA
jgi:predicted TIM-barrel fold metal-dependent hydrolase